MALNLNLDVIMKRPTEQKLLILAGILVFIFLIYIWLGYLPKRKILAHEEGELTKQETTLNQLKRIASDLPKFREEVQKLEERLKEALIKLPNKSEIPAFLLDISNQGKEVGLEFSQFKPKSEVKKGLYAEVPVDIKVRGSYHEIGTFFDRVSRLPRIVNIRDITLGGAKDVAGRWVLESGFNAVIFRFLEEGEIQGETKSGTVKK